MNERKQTVYGRFLLLLGVLFIVLGVWRAEPGTVFVKAANICLECIGIG